MSTRGGGGVVQGLRMAAEEAHRPGRAYFFSCKEEGHPPPPPKGPLWETTKVTVGKILSGPFWCTKFWVPDPPAPPSPLLPLIIALPPTRASGYFSRHSEGRLCH